MKKIIEWLFRIACIAVICAAGYTLVNCILHMNDDHSYEALMGTQTSEASFQEPTVTITEPVAENSVIEEVDENPTVSLSCADSVSVYQPYLAVTASFNDIETSISADLKWYVNGELVSSEEKHLLAEGSTVDCSLMLDTSEDAPENAEVRLEVDFQGKSIDAEETVTIIRPTESGMGYVRTEQISASVTSRSSIYAEPEEDTVEGTVKKGATGLLLGYETNSADIKMLQIQMNEGNLTGWIEADSVEITTEDCTTDEDYEDTVKEDFVNSMGYDSHTDYLIWVSLYTQRVNIFTGYQGNWTLYKCFECSTGANETPTTTGAYTYEAYEERWDLGDTYVSPVMIFNGGEAFTSRPYKTKNDKLADKTIGSPVSGGSVRMLDDDIGWMADIIPTETLVIVY